MIRRETHARLPEELPASWPSEVVLAVVGPPHGLETRHRPPLRYGNNPQKAYDDCASQNPRPFGKKGFSSLGWHGAFGLGVWLLGAGLRGHGGARWRGVGGLKGWPGRGRP